MRNLLLDHEEKPIYILKDGARTNFMHLRFLEELLQSQRGQEITPCIESYDLIISDGSRGPVEILSIGGTGLLY